MNFLELALAVQSIASGVAQCDSDCSGIRHDRRLGILPRCLFLEAGENRSDERDEMADGTIVVGMNPGTMGDVEKAKIVSLLAPVTREEGVSPGGWESVTVAYYAWLQETIARAEPFYTLLRSAIRSGGRSGPILWTEVLKCETRKPKDAKTKKKGLLEGNPETVQRCTSRFLGREMAIAPKNWPVLAAGRPAFDWVSENVKDRSVIGVPHPSGAAFDFVSVFPAQRVDARRLDWRHPGWLSAKDS